MTVAELIERLSLADGNLPVWIGVDRGYTDLINVTYGNDSCTIEEWVENDTEVITCTAEEWEAVYKQTTGEEWKVHE